MIGKTVKHVGAKIIEINAKPVELQNKLINDRLLLKKIPSKSSIRILTLRSNDPRSICNFEPGTYHNVISPLSMVSENYNLQDVNSSPNFNLRNLQVVRKLPEMRNQIEVVRYANETNNSR